MDDLDLVRRLREGDPTALRGVYQRYKDEMLTVACCLMGERSSGEDVLHDVFVSLAGVARRLQVRDTLRGYLITSVANRARDHLRRRRRGPLAMADPPEPLGGLFEDPAGGLIEVERAERLYLALGELPYEQREVISLHLQGGMTFKQIAGELGVSINTVQSRYRYGLDKLRSSLRVEANT